MGQIETVDKDLWEKIIKEKSDEVLSYINNFDTLTLEERNQFFICAHTLKSSCIVFNMNMSAEIFALFEEVLIFLKTAKAIPDIYSIKSELQKISKFLLLKTFGNCNEEQRKEFNKCYDALAKLSSIEENKDRFKFAEYIYSVCSDNMRNISKILETIDNYGVVNGIHYENSKLIINFSSYLSYENICFALKTLGCGKVCEREYVICKNIVSVPYVNSLFNLVGSLARVETSNEKELIILKKKANLMFKMMRMASIADFFSNFMDRIIAIARLKHQSLYVKYECHGILMSGKIQAFILDPVLQLIRNYIFHTLADDHVKRELFITHEIIITSKFENNRLKIIVFNGGSRLDYKSIKERAIANGYIKRGVKLTKEDIGNLIFLPNNSTAKNVNEMGGRGVGLFSIVKKLKSRDGTIKVLENKSGLTFIMDFFAKEGEEIVCTRNRTCLQNKIVI